MKDNRYKFSVAWLDSRLLIFTFELQYANIIITILDTIFSYVVRHSLLIRSDCDSAALASIGCSLDWKGINPIADELGVKILVPES